MASCSKRTRSSFSPTNQTQTMPVILLSSKILVFTESTVMVGPPDFSTTRSPDLKTVIGGLHDKAKCQSIRRTNTLRIPAAVPIVQLRIAQSIEIAAARSYRSTQEMFARIQCLQNVRGSSEID